VTSPWDVWQHAVHRPRLEWRWHPKIAHLACAMAGALGAIIYAARAAEAQTVLEDASGRTSLVSNGGLTYLGVNTAAATAELGWFYLANRHPVLAGLSAKAKSVEGVAPLFGSGETRAGAQVQGILGWKSSHLIVAARYAPAWAEQGLIDTAATPTPTLTKDTRRTWDAAAHAQWFPLENLGGGVAVGRRRTNNYGDLKKRTYRTLRTATDPSTGTSVEVGESQEGRIGGFREETVTFLDTDLLYVLKGRSASIRPFGRFLFDRSEGSKQRVVGGIDLGVHKRGGDPILHRRFAVVLQVDEYRRGDDSPDIKDRLTLSAVANLAPLVNALAGVGTP
jgi:hypothetical protein